MRHVGEALTEAKYAYSVCLKTNDSSSDILSQFILRTKQAQWQSRETARLREMNDTLATVEMMLEDRLKSDIEDLDLRFKDMEIGETGRDEERTQLEKEAEDRRKNVRAAFADKSKPETAERVCPAMAPPLRADADSDCDQVVPDHLIDSITFEIMHDPVVTPSGNSYERVGLLKHLRATGMDPLTREPLSEKQLYPNYGLRNACSDFIESNGWAVDY